MSKVISFFRAFRDRLDDQSIIRHQREEILRLNKSIDSMLINQNQYHKKHVKTNSKTLEEREVELRREFQTVLNIKNSEIKSLKTKYKDFWNAYEDMLNIKIKFENLKIVVVEKTEITKKFNGESIKGMEVISKEIGNFLSSIKQLEEKVQKKIPEM